MGFERLHESSKDRRKVISIKDTIKEENPVARRERLHESSKDRRKVISVKDTIEEKKKNPVDKMTQNLQGNRDQVDDVKYSFDIYKEENPVARLERLHESSKNRRKVISFKNTIEEEKKNPVDKMTQNLQDNRRTVHHFKRKKGKEESYTTPEIHIRRAKLSS